MNYALKTRVKLHLNPDKTEPSVGKGGKAAGLFR
jgi:hypothetical protein